jgi:SSS family solute:Na+ symporter
MGLVLLYLKFNNPDTAFTHTLNQLRYFINYGIVVLICSAVIMTKPNHRGALIGFIITVPMQFLILWQFPGMNYFVRAFWVIISGLFVVSALSWNGGFINWKKLFYTFDKSITRYGWLLLLSLITLQIVFH